MKEFLKEKLDSVKGPELDNFKTSYSKVPHVPLKLQKIASETWSL